MKRVPVVSVAVALRSKEQFAELLSGSQHRVVACIFSLVHNMQDTEEIFQQTCLTMWEKFEAFEPGTDFGGWACSIARLKVRSFLQKRRSSRVTFSDEFLDQQAIWEEAASGDTEDRLMGALRGCMERLSQRDRQLLDLRYGGQVMVGAIAQRLDRSPQSVSNSLGRVRGWLLECVKRTLAAEGC